jgi:glycosyltransferase involved in cell wall biosynthesis
MRLATFVSVVIGAYNHGKYLETCVNSVLNQSYRNFEIIVVDDGSTDDTRAVADKFNDKITYIYQANCGRGSSRNAGIRQAKHDWIAFLDADDLWMRDKLLKQIAAVEEHPQIDILATNANWFDDSGIIKENYFATMRLLPKEPTENFGSLHIFRNKIFPLFIRENFINLSSMLIRKKCFEEQGYLDETLPRCQDRDLWIRLSRHYNFAYLDEILTNSRANTLGDGSNTEPTLKSRCMVFEKARDRRGEWETKYAELINESLRASTFDLAYFYFNNYDFAKARAEFKALQSLGEKSFKIKIYSLLTCFPTFFVKILRKIISRR